MPAPPPLRVSARASTGVVPALPTRTRAEDPALHEAALAQFAAIRAVPGAAPLVDDIVEYIRRSPPGTVSLARLPRAPNGLAVLDARASDAMIPDPEIRRKWDELARLLRSHASRTDHPAR